MKSVGRKKKVVPAIAEDSSDQEGLKSFGRLVEVTRINAGKSQKQLGEALGDKSQSYVARLERGLVDPSFDVVRKLSGALNLPPEHMAALVLQEKYKLKQEFVQPLLWRPKTIDELATWEMSSDHRELWIVTPEFVDLNFEKMRKEAQEFLRLQGKSIVFFIGLDQKENFEIYKRKIEISGPELSAVFLNKARLGLLTAACVLANPMAYEKQDTEPDFPKGYIILSNEKESPVLALQMSKLAALKRSEQLDLLRHEIQSPKTGL